MSYANSIEDDDDAPAEVLEAPIDAPGGRLDKARADAVPQDAVYDFYCAYQAQTKTKHLSRIGTLDITGSKIKLLTVKLVMS